MLAVFCVAMVLQKHAPNTAFMVALDSDRLFQITNVWTVHLKFTKDQWEAMEPKGGFNMFAAFSRAASAAGLKSLSSAIMSQGDQNHDGRLSREEFAALAQKWFKAWDTNRTGKLNAGQIRDGLNSAAKRTGGRGGAGGGGFPGLGMMLQGPEGKRNGLASALGIEFVYVHADLEFGGRLLKDVGVRYKGNGTFLESRGSLKRSLKVDLRKFVNGQRLGDVTMLTLQNNVTDASWMNEVLAYLFLAISAGLGLGAGQTLLTIVALVIILGLIMIRSTFRASPGPPNLYLTVTSPAAAKLGVVRLLQELTGLGASASLKRFDQTAESLEAAFLVDFKQVAHLEQFTQRLRELSPDVKVSCLDDRGLLG